MNWPLVKLGDVCTLLNGRAYKKDELLQDGKYPVLRVGNFFSNREWYYSDLELPEKNYCERGDLLYAWSASFGPRIWDGCKVIYHYHIWKVEIDESKVDKNYLCHVLEKDVEDIKREQGTGSTMIHVTKTAMENREIPLPPLAEQKRIAVILDKADALRRKRQQAIDLADQFLRSVFLEMFGDPVTNPMGWPTKPLSQMASVITGYPFKSSDYIEESKGTVRLCRGANVLPGALDWKDTRFWSRDRLDGLDDYLLEQGDIILAMDRPWISSGLKVCHAEVSDIPTYLVQRVARIRAGTQSMQDLIYASIDSVAFERHCCPTETTIPHISPVELKAFPIFDVPADLLERFSRVVRTSLRKTKSFAFAEDQSEVLFSSISQQAFRGDL
ncbi:type I restriction enzyme S subunit [Marinobacterium halophilum]|uniref:Type I restriction enzyme S subunit n=1 Tax=Marinobacterium halophilum TaxID=267374 RepID=A0A2P8EUI6_9GAMM|nr:restriction endonuclease subunit S [Marinobacterium halophilum]PSL13095.1 type I restriction enzyme S subunit [Marinobacterium halophilum]